MLDRIADALTGRRLGGALLVLCGLVLLAALVWPSSEPDGLRGRVQQARIVSVPQLGLTFAYPSSWSQSVAGRVIRLRSPDRSTVLTFASPVAGSHTRPLLRDARRTLLASMRRARVVREGPGRLGTQPVRTFELAGLNADGHPQRALAYVGSTRHRTYVVTLLTPGRPSARRLAEVQRILATVRLVEPRAGESRG